MYYTLDFEVFAHNWLLVAKDIESGKIFSCWDDNTALKKFHAEDNVYIGFNIKHYDQYIMKAILLGAEPEQVKKINDWIIAERQQGFEHWFLKGKYLRINCIDVFDDMQDGMSLKAIEGHLYRNIVESSIPFDIDRPLTEEEKHSTFQYCLNDVNESENLFNLREEYVQTKMHLAELANLDPVNCMGMTNAKLTAQFLGAEKIQTYDEREYVFPREVDQEMMPEQVDFFSQIYNSDLDDEELFTSKREIMVGNLKAKYGWGGVHGGIENFVSNGERILNYDVASLYPSLMLEYGYLSRAIRDSEKYRKTYDERQMAKKQGNKPVSDALKLVLNTAFGAMINRYNPLYDPLMGRSVCITGQLLLTELALKLYALGGILLLNFNTDGIMFSLDPEKESQVEQVVEEWQKKTRLVLEKTVISSIVQKDVNNYWECDLGGKEKTKGSYLSYGISEVGAWSVNNNFVIVKKAILQNFKGIPVRRTIEECNDIRQFQLIAKAGSKYREAYHEIGEEQVSIQKVNRVYATKDTRYGTLYKVKQSDSSIAKIEMIPQHAIIDNDNKLTIDSIDKEWYIDLAERRVAEFRQGKIKGGKRMATRTTKVNEIEKEVTQTVVNPRIALLGKIFALQKVLASYGWEKDGTNQKQMYKYIKEAQYKNNFKTALIETGLLWKMEMTSSEFIPAISEKMHLMKCVFEGRLIDYETGEEEVYRFEGTGADNGDKALYKAVTGGHKFFIASNFNIAESNDPEDDEIIDKPKYTTPEKREEVKTELTSPDRPATTVQLKSLCKIANEVIAKDSDYKDSIEEALGQKLTAKEAEEMILQLKQVLEEMDG